MRVLQFFAPLLTAFFGIYCLVWSLVATSFPTQQRGGAAFIGLLFLLLTCAYVRFLIPRKQPRTL